MGAYKCEHHGMQIASIFCKHAAAAIHERRPFDVFLQKDEWGWSTLCQDCVRSEPESSIVENADLLVCVECILEWAELTNSTYLARCKDPKPEFPPDLVRD